MAGVVAAEPVDVGDAGAVDVGAAPARVAEVLKRLHARVDGDFEARVADVLNTHPETEVFYDCMDYLEARQGGEGITLLDFMVTNFILSGGGIFVQKYREDGAAPDGVAFVVEKV